MLFRPPGPEHHPDPARRVYLHSVARLRDVHGAPICGSWHVDRGAHIIRLSEERRCRGPGYALHELGHVPRHELGHVPRHELRRRDSIMRRHPDPWQTTLSTVDIALLRRFSRTP